MKELTIQSARLEKSQINGFESEIGFFFCFFSFFFLSCLNFFFFLSLLCSISFSFSLSLFFFRKGLLEQLPHNNHIVKYLHHERAKDKIRLYMTKYSSTLVSLFIIFLFFFLILFLFFFFFFFLFLFLFLFFFLCLSSHILAGN